MAVTVQLIGGLGNQMFQYAAAFSLADRLGEGLLLDVSVLASDQLRDYELKNVFAIQNSIISNCDLSSILNRHNRLKNRIGTRLYNFLYPYYKRPFIHEPFFHFDSNFVKYTGNSVLHGYWQSEKYFSPVKDKIGKIFSFGQLEENMGLENTNFLSKIRQTNSVSIHIRRTDYLTSASHEVLQLNYYNKAIELLESKIGTNLTYFIFTDDHDWARENLKINSEIIFVKGNSGEKSYIDMFLMSNCKSNIIANSSFSWWAAWLNSNSNKIIIAPEVWFSNSKLNTKDLLPENWIKL